MTVALRKAMRAYLLADTALYVATGGRVFWGRMPQQERRPSLVLQMIGETTTYHYEGPAGLVTQRIQAVGWGTTQEDASRISGLAKARLSGAAGVWMYGTASPQEGVRVDSVFAEESDDIVDDPSQLLGERRDYMITYEE